ncbi:MAG: tetratricopeptide repeat protein [Pseudomonadota bacterium]
MKRSVALVALIILLGMPMPCPSQGQSKAEGMRLFSQAQLLHSKARNNADLELAVQKYQQALTTFERVGFEKGIGLTAGSLSNIYGHWGNSEKALEYLQKAFANFQKIGDVGNVAQASGNMLFYEAQALERKAKTNVELEQAVQKYRQALTMYERIRFEEGICRTAGNLGNILGHWGQWDKALEHYHRVLEISQKTGDLRNVGKSLGNIGAVYYHWGKNAKALEFYQKDLAICRKIGDANGERAILMNLGNVCRAWGRYSQAVSFYEKALGIAGRIRDTRGEGDVLNNLGNVYSDWGRYDKATELYARALEIRRRTGDVRGEGGSLHNLAKIYMFHGQYAKSAEFLEKALALFVNINDPNDQVAGLIGLGTLFMNWAQYAKALEFFDKALMISRKIGDVKGEAHSLVSFAEVYRTSGQNGRALEFYDKALQIQRKIGNLREQGVILTYIGATYRGKGEQDKALSSYRQAMALYVKLGIPVARLEVFIGDLYLDMGDIDKAEPFMKRAAGDSSLEPDIRHYSLARLSLAKADYSEAGTWYKKMLQSCEQSRDSENLFIAYTGLGMCLEGMGENLQAIEHYQQAVALAEDIRSSLTPSEREAFLEGRAGGFHRTAPYEGLARVLAKMNRPVEALRETEYTRARTFAEAISRRSDSSGIDVPKNLSERDSELNNELSALMRSLHKAYQKQNKEQTAVLEPQEKEARKKLSLHVDMLRKEYPLFAATKYPQPMALSQTDLKDDEWALAYHVTDTGIIIYLSKGKTLLKGLFKPIPRKEVDELVRKFRQPMEIGPDDSVVKKLAAFDFVSGKQLSDLLLSEILSDLPKDTPVIILPDGSLGVVPFEMLVLNDGGKVMTDKNVPYTTGAEFFGDRNPISYYQSITALTLVRTLGKQQETTDRLLAMVDPVFSSDDPRLMKLAKDKKETLLRAIPKDLLMSIQTENGLTFPRLPLTGQLGESLKKADAAHTDLYEGTAAKKSVLFEKDLTAYRSLVFGTHGYFGKDLPGIQEPVLVLSLVGEAKGNDGFLRLSEVMGLKINCDIAALTACQTGLGRHVSGEGTMGMGRAFQYAGARSVLMSLWSVAESSSVDLVENFFRHLKEGKNRLEALKLAREEIRKAGYDHPFFWAPFIFVGEVR